MGAVIDNIMYILISFLDNIIPALNLPPGFVSQVDNALSTILGIINSAGYFIPLSVLSSCFTVVLLVDTFTLTMRLVQYVIGLIRG